jgi:hypothetical protein
MMAGPRVLPWLVGFILALGVFPACGGKSAGTSGNGGGANASGGSCSIAAGSYTQHFTAEPGGMNCGNVPDQTVTINGSEMLSGGTSSSPADGGQGCTVNVDTSTCTLTEDCMIMASTLTEHIALTFTFSGSGATGKETIMVADSTSGTTSNCTYDIVMTKN